ncbi:MAG: DUF559 domain-containing protein [Patescibacteria group bacterium]|jgi:very-short-patch-repair endonuclease
MRKILTNRARVFRKKQTSSEAILWQNLRNKKLLGYKFYRQYPINNYIVDFCCPIKRLIIEVDGGGHNYDEQKAKDETRDIFLKKQKFYVLRFWSNDIHKNLSGVMETIFDFLSPLSFGSSPA